jgi:hypothetical protein
MSPLPKNGLRVRVAAPAVKRSHVDSAPNPQRDVAIQLRVTRTVDLAHAPSANLGDNLIRAETSAGRKRHGLSRRSRDYTEDGRLGKIGLRLIAPVC